MLEIKNAKTIKGPCILCGNDKHSLMFSKNQWKIYKCDLCGVGVLNPQ